MGIPGLLKDLEVCMEKKSLIDLENSVAAIDVSIWIYQAQSVNLTHEAYLSMRITQLREHNIEPIIVMDGEATILKAETLNKRRLNWEKYNTKSVDVVTTSQSTSKSEFASDEEKAVNIVAPRGELYEFEIINFCKKRNIPFIVAPYEADSQVTWLVKAGIADFAISEDSDLIVFGCPKVLYKFRKGEGLMFDQELMTEYIGEGFSYSKLMQLSILAGCDYLPGGLPGFGVVKLWKCYNHFQNDNIPLDQIEAYINSEFKLSMSDDFKEKYMLAVKMFQHQVILNPITGAKQPFSPYPMNATTIDTEIGSGINGKKGQIWLPYQNLQENLSVNAKSLLAFKCRYCDVIFQNIYERGVHISNHDKILCDKCGEFIFPDNMNYHLKHFHVKSTDHICYLDGCMKRFTSGQNLRRHTQLIHAPLCHVCEKCGKDFRMERSLKVHIYKIHSESSLVCKHCEKVLGSTALLQMHLQTHIVRDPSFKCDVCNKGFQTEEDVQEHKRLRHENLYKCMKCTLSFKKQYLLNAHYKYAHLEVTFLCEYCLKDFKTLKSLQHHVADQHRPSSTGIFECDICNKTFRNKYSLRKHKLGCHSTTVLKCDTCSFSSKSIRSIRQHMYSHSRVYKCDICARVFTKKYLKRHIAVIHQKVRYKCNQCDKEFKSRSNMYAHVKRFHQIVYVDCPDCGKAFNSVYLYEHVNRVHPKQILQCEICGKIYKTKKSLDFHQVNKHEKDI